jgi:uncharacterized protein (DUF1697 family)
MADTLILLRGVNVGGHRKLPMAELRTIAEGLGHTGVRSYIQSGNLVFDRAVDDLAQVAADLEQALREAAGVDTTALVRTKAELEAVAAQHPFFENAEALKWLHVAFLKTAPDSERLAAFDPSQFLPEEVLVADRAVYLHFPNGSAKTKLGPKFPERRLGVVGTGRNWRTVGKLVELMNAEG